MNYEILFLKSLLYTISIESIVLFILFKTVYKTVNVSNWILLFIGIITTFSTLPYVWFILPTIISNKLFYIITSELTAVIIESIIILVILKIKYKNAILISFICNAASFLIGLFCNNLL